MLAGIPAVKMNGTRNAFVLVDARSHALPDDLGALARRVCSASAGVGADGLLVVHPAGDADARMQIINADGSEALMCGNGIRCVARFLDEHDGRENALIATASGAIQTRVLARTPYSIAEVMNEPRVDPPVVVDGWEAWPVDVGNSHLVIFVADLAAIDIHVLGPHIERASGIESGVNVHFAEHIAAGLRVVHWERGAGATAACGTGAVACAAAAIEGGRARSPLDVFVPGGTLRVEWRRGERATLIGDAVREFDTTIA